jgi:hypothetical protein
MDSTILLSILFLSSSLLFSICNGEVCKGVRCSNDKRVEGGVHELPTIEETDKDNEDVNDFKFKPMD